ncbi:MFS transporter [Pseudarthrobacter chlorophenolicus]|uniref:MFS transporter n=1 Tax=Pseudarthrobacter chlorophenolicus TaxID=85085 RepID=UPI0005F2CDEA|nr:MFS transporter [Pseudarthrobacter chlorophenolicus]
MAIMAEHEVVRVQRRTVALLAAAQVFGGIGTGATVSIGSILAVELSGSGAWAGAVATVMTLGAAVSALPLAALADRRGRRAGQVAGMLAALAGALLMVLSVVTGVFVLLLLGAAGIGAGTAANLQARFAAVDLADAGHRGRALATVVWAVTIGAVAGPNLIQPGAAVGLAMGLPPVAGPFVISSAGLLVAIILVFAGLRPDPLLLARELAGRAGDAGTGTSLRPTQGGRLARGMRAIRGSRMALLAVTAVVGAHAVMVGVMSMTPLHLQHLVEGAGMPHAGHAADGGALVVIGFTISLHIAGMFALSPVMGWLTDKAGRTETIMLGFATLIAGVAVAGFGQDSTVAVAAGLVLLGLGWSASTVAGSTLLAESVEQDERVVVQGVSDMLMGAAGAVGGAASGLVLSGAGYFGLNVLAGAIAACVLAGAAITRARAPRNSAAA